MSPSYRPQTKFAKVMFLQSFCSQGGSIWAGTPPGRYTPRQAHPLGRYPPAGTPPWAGTPPGSSACWEIQATSRRYASYWNVFLLFLLTLQISFFFGFQFIATFLWLISYRVQYFPFANGLFLFPQYCPFSKAS